MKNYEKPVIITNDEIAEGVYAASGDCYTFTAEIKQKPETGRGDYRIQVNGKHDASDDHHSSERTVQITFNMNVKYKNSLAQTVIGDGTSMLTLTYVDGVNGSYHNNGHENIGLGDLFVEAEPGLAITGVSCTYCNHTCTYAGH